MDEEKKEKAPCIQDRLRSVAMRSKNIFASWPIICLTIIILIIIKLPEILPIIYGREVMIPILSEISLEGRFVILFSFSVAIFSSLQYKMNKSILKIEEQRNQPFLYAEISHDRYNKDNLKILIENRGGGIAWGCRVSLSRGDVDEFFEEIFEEIYPWSGEEIEMPKEWSGQSFDMCVEIDYHIGKYPTGESRHWERVFRDLAPF